MNHRRKRNSRNSQQKIVYEDDLAVAARAAAADTRYLHTTQDFSQMRSNDVNVRNINGSSSNMSDDVDNANCISYLVPYGTSSEEENEDDDIDNISESSSSDDESDIDLTEALSKMVAGDQEDECESGKRIRIRTSSLQGPKTAHELETYGSSYVLAVTIAMTSDQLSKVSPSDLGIAGNVKFHLVNERTVVVESLVGHLPLDEGSLLVLYEKVDQENAEEIFLLGNVFEVFGPVARPLYTVRLPSLSNTITNPEVPNKNVDTEEISLGDLSEADSEVVQFVDEWCHDGRLTNLLKRRTSIPVYFLQNESKLIDTNLVIKQSGRGCDASNIHDEEMNREELDFSDDEKEKYYKLERKKTRQKRRVLDGGMCSAAAAANSSWGNGSLK